MKIVRCQNGIYSEAKMMYEKTKLSKTLFVGFFAILIIAVAAPVLTAKLPVSKTDEQEILEEKKDLEQAVVEEELTPASLGVATENLPADDSPRYALSNIAFSGNSLFSDTQLLKKIPDIYNASGDGLVESGQLFDLRSIKAIAAQPGVAQDVTARSIQGFTQYILSIYQKKQYAGILVYLPGEALEPDGALAQGTLPVRILEAPVSQLSSAYYDVTNVPSETTYLKVSALEGWSPVKEGEVINRKELDDYINLLNLNPDRYVSGVVSKGTEPDSLAVQYNVYEANPWHYFVQVDNSGTDDVQWRPRIGLINTDLLGFDDKFTLVYQTTPDKTWDENYAVFGAYDFPIAGPKLRLKLFAGYSRFDIDDPDVDFFRGNGTFYGGQLRYNAMQSNDWFFDVTGTIQHEESRVNNDLYNIFRDSFGIDLNTDIRMTLWGVGAELYKTTDMTDSFFGAEYFETMSSSDEFKMNLARPGGAEDDFSIYYLTARHSRYQDADKISRLTASARYIGTNDRLVNSKMTSFGGMYTVRGYEELDTTADGGLIASLQYEYDMVRADQIALLGQEADPEKRKPFLRKLAPLVFVDYGRAEIQDALSYEDSHTELCSVGGGIITELGDNLTGTVYYGYPLIETDDTGRGNGRVHAGILLRW